jgi:hypothetical protein
MMQGKKCQGTALVVPLAHKIEVGFTPAGRPLKDFGLCSKSQMAAQKAAICAVLALNLESRSRHPLSQKFVPRPQRVRPRRDRIIEMDQRVVLVILRPRR